AWLGRRANLVSPDQAAQEGFSGGYTIEDVVSTGTRLATTINGTLMRIDLRAPLAAGDSTSLEIGYRFVIPPNGSDRFGRTRFPGRWTYAIAQWFPRGAVYDDVRGWNIEQFLGQGEFYLEYGDIDYAITVPRSFVVTGTGTLTNPEEVLTPAEQRRLAVARASDSIVRI